jgi:hypothetical protein
VVAAGVGTGAAGAVVAGAVVAAALAWRWRWWRRCLAAGVPDGLLVAALLAAAGADGAGVLVVWELAETH